MDERLIRLFDEELRHLRETGAEFGRAFPDAAQHLDPGSEPFRGLVADPYVERLLEGTAFLAARVRLKLEAQFPQFTQGLLETLYPDFLAPVPSMAIFELEPSPDAPPPPEGLLIEKSKTQIHGLPADETEAASGKTTPCIFTMAHDLKLLPVSLVKVDWLVRRLHEAGLPDGWNAGSALRMRLRKNTDAPWSEIQLDPLVIHVVKNGRLGYEILEQLFARQIGMTIRNLKDPRQPNVLARKGHTVRKYGFDDNSALLPVTARTFQGHRLLREYFALPERFMFFELKEFQAALAECEGDEIEIVIAMADANNDLERSVNPSCLRLNCVPAINLFSKSFSQVIEPQRFSEFHLVPDAGRPLNFEVYSAELVEGFSDSSQYGQTFRPFFETDHLRRSGNAFYTLTRQPRSRSETDNTGERIAEPYSGSEVFMSFVDARQAPFDGDINQLAIQAKVTNRHLPLRLAERPSRWQLSGGAKARVSPLGKPTRPHYRPVDGAYAWRLLNLLAVNYMSLGENKSDGAAVLREMLALYAADSSDWATSQINSLRNIVGKTISRPLFEPGKDGAPPRIAAIVRGLEIGLVFEESAFLDLGVTVLGSVLEEFFGRYVAINSFAETVLKTTEDRERIRWPSRAGLKPTL